MVAEALRDNDGPQDALGRHWAQGRWVGRARLHPLLLEATVGEDHPSGRLLDHDRVGGPICDVETTELDGLLRSDPIFGRSALRHGNVSAVVVQEVRGHQRLGPREGAKKIGESYATTEDQKRALRR